MDVDWQDQSPLFRSRQLFVSGQYPLLSRGIYGQIEYRHILVPIALRPTLINQHIHRDISTYIIPSQVSLTGFDVVSLRRHS